MSTGDGVIMCVEKRGPQLMSGHILFPEIGFCRGSKMRLGSLCASIKKNEVRLIDALYELGAGKRSISDLLIVIK